MRSVLLILCVVLLAIFGCSRNPDGGGDSVDALPWKHRAMAEIAIVSVTQGTSPDNPQPKVGDKCPDCGDNDPDVGCPVGKTGDGSDCYTCRRCNGDGRIDDRDLTSFAVETPEQFDPPMELEPIPDLLPDSEPAEPVKSIVLRMPYAKGAWAMKWWRESRKSFTDAGWNLKAEIVEDIELESPYFVVRDGDAETEFHEPLTQKLLDEWER